LSAIPPLAGAGAGLFTGLALRSGGVGMPGRTFLSLAGAWAVAGVVSWRVGQVAGQLVGRSVGQTTSQVIAFGVGQCVLGAVLGASLVWLLRRIGARSDRDR
jgi:hypothetical protein